MIIFHSRTLKNSALYVFSLISSRFLNHVNIVALYLQHLSYLLHEKHVLIAYKCVHSLQHLYSCVLLILIGVIVKHVEQCVIWELLNKHSTQRYLRFNVRLRNRKIQSICLNRRVFSERWCKCLVNPVYIFEWMRAT